jgi:hypothetical protein
MDYCLANLETLRLCGHQLTGSIPVELAEISNLDHFLLSANDLEGKLDSYQACTPYAADCLVSWLCPISFRAGVCPPSWLHNVQPTRVVFLPDQNFLPKSGLLIFSGDIRTYLGLLENLQFYSLTRMTFTVQIPADLGKLTR